MIGIKAMITGFLLCALYKGTQAVGPTYINAATTVRHIGGQSVFTQISIGIEANPPPTVYVCPYLKVNNTVNDDWCINKIRNGDLQALIAMNKTEENYNKYHTLFRFTGNNSYWYVYEKPAACWRSQVIYATNDNQNYTKMYTWDPIKYAPVIRKAEFNETSLCVNAEVRALDDGLCSDFQYQIRIDRDLELQADSCASCTDRSGCCKSIVLIQEISPKFNGTISEKTVNFEHCMDSNFIRKPNTTYNDTSEYKEHGLFRIKSIKLDLVPLPATIGAISGPEEGDTFVLPLYATAATTTTTTSSPTTTSAVTLASNGDILGAGKAILIISILIVLIQGYVY